MNSEAINAILARRSIRKYEDKPVEREKIDRLNDVTHTLAENMMNTAVSTALKGTKV